MLNRYLFKFLFRIGIFITILFFYVINKPLLLQLITTPIHQGITSLHLLWLIFMITMLFHLFPKQNLSMALLKSQKETFEQQENHNPLILYRHLQKQNIAAWRVMLIWICFNMIFGLLYAFDIINEADLFMLTVFYYLCDYICILIYCPFQSFLMKNKCCVNCRIYDWGHFMMFTPMLFIKSFYTWSLFFMSLIVLIKWELIYAKHPERFFEGSNKKLQCQHCKDKTCQIKNNLKKRGN